MVVGTVIPYPPAPEQAMEEIARAAIGDEPLPLEFLKSLAAMRWFDAAVLERVLPGQAASASSDVLASLAASSLCDPYAGRGFALKPPVREFLLSGVDEAGQRALHAAAATVHRSLLEALGLANAEDRFENATWKALAAEWLYQLARVDGEQAVAELMRFIAEAFAVRVSARQDIEFAYELLNRVDFDQLKWSPASPTAARVARLCDQVKALLASRDQDAADLLEELAQVPGLTTDQRAPLYRWLGIVCFRNADRPGKAATALRTACDLVPQDGYTHLALAQLSRWFDPLAARLDLAREYADNAMSYDPESGDGQVELGDICQAESDWEGAIQWYETALLLAADSADAWLGLSEVYAARRRKAPDDGGGLSDLEQAIRCIDEAEKLNPGIHYYALIRKGQAYREAWRLEDARRCYETARADGPERPDAYLELGRLQTLLWQDRQAEESFRLALAKDAAYSRTHVLLARLYAGQDKPGRANEQCLEALGQGVESMEIRRELHDLYAGHLGCGGGTFFRLPFGHRRS